MFVLPQPQCLRGSCWWMSVLLWKNEVCFVWVRFSRSKNMCFGRLCFLLFSCRFGMNPTSFRGSNMFFSIHNFDLEFILSYRPGSCTAFGMMIPPAGTRVWSPILWTSSAELTAKTYQVCYDVVADPKTGRPRAENVEGLSLVTSGHGNEGNKKGTKTSHTNQQDFCLLSWILIISYNYNTCFVMISFPVSILVSSQTKRQNFRCNLLTVVALSPLSRARQQNGDLFLFCLKFCFWVPEVNFALVLIWCDLIKLRFHFFSLVSTAKLTLPSCRLPGTGVAGKGQRQRRSASEPWSTDFSQNHYSSIFFHLKAIGEKQTVVL